MVWEVGMNEKKQYEISIWGCDDSTHFQLELNDSEFKLIKLIEEKSKEHSEYQCMPTLEIEARPVVTKADMDWAIKTCTDRNCRCTSSPTLILQA